MLVLLYFLAGWVEGWTASGRTSPSMTITMGDENLPKRSAWAAIEGEEVMAQLTVWETGECEAEAYRIDPGEAVLRESAQISSVEELHSLLRKVVAVCE
ncbi:MAG: immunity protein TriTu family protein [Actinomycetota bacterium]